MSDQVAPLTDSGPARGAWLVVQLASTACVAVFVVVVEGPDGIAAWNVVPLLLALGSIPVVRGSLGSPEVRVGGTVFWVAQVTLVLLLHAHGR